MRMITRFAAAPLLAILMACAPLSPTDVPSAPQASAPVATATVAATAGGDASSILPVESPPASLLNSEWRTDFTRRTVEWREIRSGGPPKDGIPAIDNPTFESVAAAETWLSTRDPVIAFQEGDEVRAYPLAILIWHEIVNDTVGGLPVSVTFCPLCNASIVFDRRFQGDVLDFGTTGLLRKSDLVMYDRQSETWWQQFTGTGLAGRWAGEQLTFLASQVVSFGDFAAQFPDAQVLARPTLPRSYGANPYVGYDTEGSKPFLFDGDLDTRLAPTSRVMGLTVDGITTAYPFSRIAEAGAIHDTVGTTPLVVWHKPGTASALDTRSIAEGRDVGSAAVFDRRVDGRVLTFTRTEDGLFVDAETASRWTLLGLAIEGDLAGTQLAPIIAFDHFWFAWAAFHPDTELYATAQ
jgi:hypothetical protein